MNPIKYPLDLKSPRFGRQQREWRGHGKLHRQAPGCALQLAGVAGLLFPDKKFPNGKSRRVALISGNSKPHGPPPVWHIENVTIPANSSAIIVSNLRTVLIVFHGKRVASGAFYL